MEKVTALNGLMAMIGSEQSLIVVRSKRKFCCSHLFSDISCNLSVIFRILCDHII